MTDQTANGIPTGRTLQARSTAKGVCVQSYLTDVEAVAALVRVRGRRYEFAQDLSRKARKYGLSADQLTWAHLMAMELEAPQVNAPPTPPAAAPIAPIQVSGAFTALQQMFGAAAAALQHPKIRLLAGAQVVILRIAGQRSKYAGSITVTDDGDYPSNQWFGHIDPQGEFHQGRAVPAEVEALLMEFAADPAGTAAAYGRTTGECCFCQRKLTDARSTAVGYGPICAGHYQLPWGTAPAAPASPAAPRPQAQACNTFMSAGAA